MTETSNSQQTPRLSHREESLLIVKNHTLGSLVPAVFPVPLLDLIALSGIQTKMIHALCGVYGVEFSAGMSRAALTSLVSSVLPMAVAPALASLVKAIPVVGQLSGVASMLVLGGAATHALGVVFVRHFEEGGTLADFDARIVKDYFKEEFEKGKRIVLDLKAEIDKRTSVADPASPPTPGAPTA